MLDRTWRYIRPHHIAHASLWCVLLVAISGSASTLRISTGSNARLTTELEADYSTSHVFVDEVAHDAVPITIFFDPSSSLSPQDKAKGIESAEVFTNLNRRERAVLDADGDGVPDGIIAPSGNNIAAGDDRNYYKAYAMLPVNGGYQLTLNATKCGAYRLTARFRLNGDPERTYRWYGGETNDRGGFKRDHAIVVSPAQARDIIMYEANPLTIIATGTAANQRGTFADLASGLPSDQGPRFSLAYLNSLGVNTLWLQPIHPRGIAGRQIDSSTNQPFEIGSPYAVKNFFAVMPLMGKSFTPGSTPQGQDTSAGRAEAMTEFQQFVHAADLGGINIMLDAPFNHTAFDVELAPPGQRYWGNQGSNETTEIRNVEARVFSRVDEYDMRASSASNIALAPDRYDFSKFSDVFDIYFGRYAALVTNQNQQQNYLNEGDWFDYSVGDENSTGQGNGHFDVLTQRVWQYFGDYLEFWLTQTGYPANPTGEALNSTAGIDGLRADFAQGLPPQCWEYLVNRTRARKWNFVFMAESLDGGAVTYRSARHFDILDDNLIYDLHHARTAGDFDRIYDQRRQSYGSSLVLLNSTSQDEDNYKDPFEAFLRFATNSAMDGVPMIFPGQELGTSGTIVPPNDSNGALGPPFGYARYESGFFGKPIPEFKTFNSMMPLWNALQQKAGNTVHLQNLYTDVANARRASAALRSQSRIFLQLKNGSSQDQIFAVAKFASRNADPKVSDVVFAFVNLTLGSDATTPNGVNFDVNVDADHNGTNDFGIKPDHLYNVKNIAAYTGLDPHRRDAWLWGSGRTGADLLSNGIFVHLNKIPADDSGWATAPYEPQYLELFDVTSSP